MPCCGVGRGAGEVDVSADRPGERRARRHRAEDGRCCCRPGSAAWCVEVCPWPSLTRRPTVVGADGVGPRRRGGRRVVVLTVAVEVPGVGERVAVRVGRRRPVEAHGQWCRAGRLVGRDPRGGGGVGAGVDDPVDAGRVLGRDALVVEPVVDVVEVPAGAGHQVHRRLGGLHERQDDGRVGVAVRLLAEPPDARPREVREEQRALVGRRGSCWSVDPNATPESAEVSLRQSSPGVSTAPRVS